MNEISFTLKFSHVYTDSKLVHASVGLPALLSEITKIDSVCACASFQVSTELQSDVKEVALQMKNSSKCNTQNKKIPTYTNAALFPIHIYRHMLPDVLSLSRLCRRVRPVSVEFYGEFYSIKYHQFC